MIVSEAYLRIAPNLDASAKRSLGESIFAVAETGARQFFATYDNPRIAEVLVEDGSTKFRARIRTSAIALITAVGGYGTVRAGIDYLRHDGRVAANWMVEHIAPQLPVPPEVVRRRTPAETRLRRLFDKVESGELSAEEASRRAEDILKEYQETADTLGIVMPRIVQELNAISPRRYVQRDRMPRPPALVSPATPLRAGKRLSIFRDPRTGRLVFSES